MGDPVAYPSVSPPSCKGLEGYLRLQSFQPILKDLKITVRDSGSIDGAIDPADTFFRDGKEIPLKKVFMEVKKRSSLPCAYKNAPIFLADLVRHWALQAHRDYSSVQHLAEPQLSAACNTAKDLLGAKSIQKGGEFHITCRCARGDCTP